VVFGTKRNRPKVGKVKFIPNLMYWRSITNSSKSPLFDWRFHEQRPVHRTYEGCVLALDQQKRCLMRIFQQDGDSCHTSKKSRHFFADNHIRILEWPANSPDLNPF
jgi:hypothetical protein